MTVKEYLESTFNPSKEYQVRDMVTCADGYTVSIQGGTHGHYCSPRTHINVYEKVELGYPSAADDELLEYAENSNDPTSSVYGYVPIDVIEAVIAKHGGIIGLPKAPKTTEQPSKAAAVEGILTEEELKERNRLLVLENDELNAENHKYKKAYDKCATGGNSLASVIVGWNLPKGWQTWTYEEASNKFYHTIHLFDQERAYECYEIWLAWKSIREASRTLEETK